MPNHLVRMTLVLPAGDMLKKIQSDLNLDEAREQEDLSKLKEWLACQPHLPQITGSKTNKLLFTWQISIIKNQLQTIA
jgi:hypothetical protein